MLSRESHYDHLSTLSEAFSSLCRLSAFFNVMVVRSRKVFEARGHLYLYCKSLLLTCNLKGVTRTRHIYKYSVYYFIIRGVCSYGTSLANQDMMVRIYRLIRGSFCKYFKYKNFLMKVVASV